LENRLKDSELGCIVCMIVIDIIPNKHFVLEKLIQNKQLWVILNLLLKPKGKESKLVVLYFNSVKRFKKSYEIVSFLHKCYEMGHFGSLIFKARTKYICVQI